MTCVYHQNIKHMVLDWRWPYSEGDHVTCVYHQNIQHMELRLEMVVFRRGSCDMCISSEYTTHGA